MILLINCFAGLVMSDYQWANVGITSAVIIANYLLIMLVCKFEQKDAFKISLSFLFILMAICEFVLGCLAPIKLESNYYLMAIVVLLVIQILMCLLTNLISKNS